MGTAVMVAFMGLFSIVGALMDWNWFLNNRRARLFVQLFGRNGARIFYIILGFVLLGVALFSGINASRGR